jgi:hypothetical protein
MYYGIDHLTCRWEGKFFIQKIFYSESWEEKKNLAVQEKRKYSDLQFSQYNMHQKKKEYDFCHV